MMIRSGSKETKELFPYLYRGLFGITAFFLIWNFLYGFRWPSEYVLSSTLFNYYDGFLPRGLIGSILKMVFRERMYHKLFLSVCIMSIGLLLLFALIYLSWFFTVRTQNIMGSMVMLWYSLSIYNAFLAHEMGYFEQYGYVLFMIALLLLDRIPSEKIYGICATGCMFLSLLISETNAFLVCPVFGAMIFFRMFQKTEGTLADAKRIFMKMVVLNIPNLVYCLFIFLCPNASEMQITRQIIGIREHADSFNRLEEIGGYYLNHSRLENDYTHSIPITTFNWQLMAYLFVIVFCVSLALYFSEHGKEMLCYLLLNGFIFACGYGVCFIAWDRERFKFCLAFSVTLFAAAVCKKVDFRKLKWNKDMVYALVIGTCVVIALMDFRLGLFDQAAYNQSIAQMVDALKGFPH